MTTIAGVMDNGRVYIGGDSASSGDQDLLIRADPKVFVNGPMVIGFTTSYRMGQVLHYALDIPRVPKHGDLDRYMVTDFIDAVRKTLRDAGFAKETGGREKGGSFLVGFRGQLFIIDSDYQVGRAQDSFAAVGSGANQALGALYATEGMTPRKRLRVALEAAERYATGVRGPFLIIKEPAPSKRRARKGR